MLPVDEAGGKMRIDEIFRQKESNHHSTEVLRQSLDIPERDMDKLAPLVKPALQDEAMEV